ncbi:MAG: Holliday junction branch migration protein RuvA [Candidatus Omnitrophota bacterium]
MIARIAGKITGKEDNCLLIDVGGITYEVFLPVMVMQNLDKSLNSDDRIELITYHYLQSDPSRSIPVLIGFLNEVEKEFFENFITVSGIGPKAALRALNKPISQIAQAIDEGDIVFLKSLPGIGQQRAKEIVAKLQNKVGKFGLVKDSPAREEKAKSGIKEEVQAVLIQLGYKKAEADLMVKNALEHSSNGMNSTEELLNEVYKLKKIKA